MSLGTIAFLVMLAGLIVMAIMGGYYIWDRLSRSTAAAPSLIPDDDHPTPDTSKEGYFIDLDPPHDRQAMRDRFGRWIFVILFGFAILLIPTLIVGFWGGLFHEILGIIGMFAGLVLGLYLGYRSLSYLVIYDEEWSAYVTNDPFTGENVPYGPGAHPSYIWEQRNKRGNYSLEKITKVFTVNVSTTTSQVIATATFTYAVHLPYILNFIGNDISSIESGFQSFIESFLTEKLASKTAEEARKEIREINRDLAVEFMGVRNQTGLTTMEFGNKNGIITVSLVISGFALPAAVQKTRDAIDEGKQLVSIAAGIMGMDPAEFAKKVADGTIPWSQYEKILNRAMATSDNADLRIFAVEGDVGTAGAAMLANFFDRSGGGSGGGKKPRK